MRHVVVDLEDKALARVVDVDGPARVEEAPLDCTGPADVILAFNGIAEFPQMREIRHFPVNLKFKTFLA